ncbi:MAG: patatin-like phospholipase family protein, partial [Chitinophagales bacterium]
MVDAVLASSSFPGVLSPYEINGNLYSDGGILNHFPTD